MTKDTEALREALAAHYPTGEWMQPCGNHVLCCSCGENLWGVDRDACKAAWRTHVIEALATPASDELGFDPTAEVGDEVFPHDTISNGGGLDPAAGDVGAVAWMYEHPMSLHPVLFGTRNLDAIEGGWTETPLYARPPHPAPVDPVSKPVAPIHDDDCEAMLRPRADCTCRPVSVDPVAGGEALRELIGRLEGARPLVNSGSTICVNDCREAARALAALKGPAA